MGNKHSKKRQVVHEKYTRPQGLYQNRQLDYKWLRKHILDSKLAPCYPGVDEFDDLEECPICLLYYPCLNRSKCCTKGICTECFMQMKSLLSIRPTQCPFCKTSNYEVEYRGVRTKEEKGQDQIEEQRVIEAKIRIRQQEIQNEKERILLSEEKSSSNEIDSPIEDDVEFQDVSSDFFSVTPNISSIQSDDFISSEEHASVDIIRPTTFSRQTGEDDYNKDLEELMVLEAIWLSNKKNNLSQNLASLGVTASELPSSGDHYSSLPSTTDGSSPSGGIAYAIAALAERRQMGHNSNVSISDPMPSLEFQPSSSHVKTYQGKKSSWGINHDGHDIIDVGPSHATMDPMPESASASFYPVEMEESLLSSMPVPIVPESFEEQMKLAIAASLAESYPRHHRHGLV